MKYPIAQHYERQSCPTAAASAGVFDRRTVIRRNLPSLWSVSVTVAVIVPPAVAGAVPVMNQLDRLNIPREQRGIVTSRHVTPPVRDALATVSWPKVIFFTRISTFLLPPPRRLCFCLCVFVRQQDNSKSCGRISINFLEGRDVNY